MGNLLNFGRPFDGAPTEGSRNLLNSGAVFAALRDMQPAITMDEEPTEGSMNPVTSDGIYNVVAGLLQTIAALEARVAALEAGPSAAVDDGNVVARGMTVEDGYAVATGVTVEDGYVVF